MILAVDCGHSRLKWGLHDQSGWIKTGSVPLSALASLKNTWKNVPPADQIVVANVAGQSARRRLENVLSRQVAAPIWVTAQRRQCGVTNNYGKPTQLGADRWAALIGAWSMLRGRQRSLSPTSIYRLQRRRSSQPALPRSSPSRPSTRPM